MAKVLIVAAHPDDEILGVGATAAKRAAQGDTVRALILGEGQTSRWESRKEASENAVADLHRDTLESAACIGYERVSFADFPDNRFDHVDLLDLVKHVEAAIREFSPEVLYTHHGGDLNIDHQRTSQAVLTAARPAGDCPVKEIYAFETLSSTEWDFSYTKPFCPNVFEAVEPFMQAKLDAMKCYRSELCDFPHPRSLEGIQISARKYGSIIGREFAEAFMLLRMIKESL